MRVSHRRSLIKTLTFRLLATISTMLVVYIFTKELTLSIGIGVVETVTKLLLYYYHERLWDKIAWGRIVHPLAELPIEGELAPEDLEAIREKLREMGYLKAA